MTLNSSEVIIFDSDKESLELWSRILEGAGFTVKVATVLEDTLAQALERTPDAFIIDVISTGKAGEKFLEL